MIARLKAGDGHAAITVCIMLATLMISLDTTIANVALPRMQAKSQNIDPVVVLLSFAFWGALWGPTGTFLSTPLTVMAIAICSEFKGSRWIAVLLSADGEPYPEAGTAEPRQSVLGKFAKKSTVG